MKTITNTSKAQLEAFFTEFHVMVNQMTAESMRHFKDDTSSAINLIIGRVLNNKVAELYQDIKNKESDGFNGEKSTLKLDEKVLSDHILDRRLLITFLGVPRVSRYIVTNFVKFIMPMNRF